MSCRETLEYYLGERGVAFETQRHSLAYTARQVAASEHLSPQLVAKVVIAFADERPVMLVVPATCRVAIGEVQTALGATRVRLAHEDELRRLFPDCDTGAMPPFGDLYGLPVYVDRELTEDDTFYFQAGAHDETMSVRYADFARLVQPAVVNIGHHVTRVRSPFAVAGVVGR